MTNYVRCDPYVFIFLGLSSMPINSTDVPYLIKLTKNTRSIYLNNHVQMGNIIISKF